MVAVGLIYAPFLQGEWVWDDRPLVAANASLRSLGGLSTVLTRDLFGGAGATPGQVYRPVAVLSIWVQAQVHGVALVPLRLGNLALLVASALALGAWLRRQRVSASVARSAELVWALHPLGVEPTLWISARPDLLASLGVFAALALWPRSHEKAPARVAGASVACLAAFLSKEPGVVAPALLVLDALRRWLSGERPATRGAWYLVPSAAVALGFLLRRALGISSTSGALQDGPLVWARTLGELLRVYVPRIVTGRSGPTIQCWNDGSVASCALWVTAWVLLTLGLAWAARRRAADAPGGDSALSAGRAFAWASLGVAWVGVTLLPSVFALPMTHLMGNRYGYLPSAGLIVAVVVLVARFVAPAVRPALLGGILVVTLGWLVAGVVDEASAWHSDLALYARSVAISPRDGCALYHYGVAVHRRGGCAASLPYFVAAANAEALYARSWHNVAGCLVQEQRFAEAVAPARRALALEPDDPRKMSNLGVALLFSGQRDEGRRWLRRVLDRNPADAQAARLLRSP